MQPFMGHFPDSLLLAGGPPKVPKEMFWRLLERLFTGRMPFLAFKQDMSDKSKIIYSLFLSSKRLHGAM